MTLAGDVAAQLAGKRRRRRLLPLGKMTLTS